MKKQRKSGVSTRGKLLNAAGEVFAAKYYREATIAEICEKAEANIAAVNYHFKDKETLYREAWRYAFADSISKYPPDGGVCEDASPEERFRGQINAILRRIADENNKELLIAQKEFVSPTGLLDEVIRKELKPMHDRTESLIRELLGSQATDIDVQYCTLSIINQCFNPIISNKLRVPRKNLPVDGAPELNNIGAFTDHIVMFSLAGLAAIRSKTRGKN